MPEDIWGHRGGKKTLGEALTGGDKNVSSQFELFAKISTVACSRGISSGGAMLS